MVLFKSKIPGESWKTFLAVVVGTWLALWFYAALHNQYLIRIAPEHFTVWHYKMPFFKSYTMLGIAYAGAASISPGLVLGVGLYIAGRLFSRPKIAPAKLVLSTGWVWLGVEVCSVVSGLVVWKTGKGIYPDGAYPDDSIGILVTQSIQITAYLSGALFSIILLWYTWHKRLPGKSLQATAAAGDDL